MFIVALFIEMELKPIQMSINCRVDKQNMICPINETLFHSKKEINYGHATVTDDWVTAARHHVWVHLPNISRKMSKFTQTPIPVHLKWVNFMIHKLDPNKLILGFPGGSVVKNPSAMQETQVQFLGREDLLEKEMATHSSFLAWRIPWTEEPGGLQSMRLQTDRHNWATKQQHQSYFYKGEYILKIALYCAFSLLRTITWRWFHIITIVLPFLKKWKCQSLSHVWLYVIPWTAAHQALLSLEFSRQEYWSG